MQFPSGQGLLRIAAILPIVLAPVVVGLVLAHAGAGARFGLVDLVTRSLGLGSHNWLGDPQLALISVIAIHTWQWTPFAFLVLLATLATLPPDVYEAARLDRASAWQRFRYITLPLIRPAIVMVLILRMMTALSAFAAIFAATGGGPGSATEILNLYAYRTSFTRAQPRLRRLARGGPDVDHARHLVPHVPVAAGARMKHRSAHRQVALAAVAGFGLADLGVPGDLGPADVVQDGARRARLSARVAVQADARQLSRGAVRRFLDPAQHLVSSCVVSLSATLLTMLFAVPASYALARLRYPAKRASGFYVLVDADAAAGRADHSLLPGAAEDRLARHLHRPHGHLSHVLAAVRRSG